MQVGTDGMKELNISGNSLKVLEKRYLKGKGYTKALYRARSQEFNKVKC